MSGVTQSQILPPPPPAVDVNWPGLVIGFLIVAFGLGLGVIWTLRRETRTRGVILLAFLLVPALLSAVMVLVRIVSR